MVAFGKCPSYRKRWTCSTAHGIVEPPRTLQRRRCIAVAFPKSTNPGCNAELSPKFLYLTASNDINLFSFRLVRRWALALISVTRVLPIIQMTKLILYSKSRCDHALNENGLPLWQPILNLHEISDLRILGQYQKVWKLTQVPRSPLTIKRDPTHPSHIRSFAIRPTAAVTKVQPWLKDFDQHFRDNLRSRIPFLLSTHPSTHQHREKGKTDQAHQLHRGWEYTHNCNSSCFLDLTLLQMTKILSRDFLTFFSLAFYSFVTLSNLLSLPVFSIVSDK